MAVRPCKDCGKDVSEQAEKCPHCGAPAPKKESVNVWVAGLVIVGVISLIAVLGETEGDDARPAPAPDPANIQMSADLQRQLTRAIQDSGFNCPLAKLARAKGEDAYGVVTKVWCGPVGDDTVSTHTVFRVTINKNTGKSRIQPWS